jgi:hypothetical protein
MGKRDDVTNFRQERPYHDDNTASRLLSEVKHRRARLVLRWGTTLESRVLFFFGNFQIYSDRGPIAFTNVNLQNSQMGNCKSPACSSWSSI